MELSFELFNTSKISLEKLFLLYYAAVLKFAGWLVEVEQNLPACFY